MNGTILNRKVEELQKQQNLTSSYVDILMNLLGYLIMDRGITDEEIQRAIHNVDERTPMDQQLLVNLQNYVETRLALSR